MAYSLNGPTANIDCWLDAAGTKVFLMIFKTRKNRKSFCFSSGQ